MNAGSFVIGRIRGVELRVHWSWIIILALATVVFGSTELPGRYPNLPEVAFWAIALVTAFLLLASALLHELAHVVVAFRNGLAGGDVNVQLLGGTYILELHPYTPGQQFRLAVVGPVVSVGVGFLCAVAAAATDQAPGDLALISYPAIILSLFNLFIGVVNLIPGYPLDGGSLVRSVVWSVSRREGRATQVAARVGRYVGYALVLLGVAVALATADPWTGLVIGLGGWLLSAGGGSMERRETLRMLVSNLRVRDALQTDVPHVPAQLTLDTFASELLSLPGNVVVVERLATPVGLIGTIQSNRVRRSWASMHAADAMVPLERIPVVSESDELWAALEELERQHLDAVVVRTEPADAAARTLVTAPAEATAAESAPAGGLTWITAPQPVTEAAEAAPVAQAEVGWDDEAQPEPETSGRIPLTLLTRRSAARAVHTLAQQQAGVALALQAMRQGSQPRFRWMHGRDDDETGRRDGDGTGGHEGDDDRGNRNGQ